MADTTKEVVVDLIYGWTDQPGKIVSLPELHFVHDVVADSLPVLDYLLGPPRYELNLIGLGLRGAKSLDLLRRRMKLALLAVKVVHAVLLFAEV